MRLRTPTRSVVARVIPCLMACALGAAGLSACSSGSAASHDGATVVRVTVRDFHIKVSPARVPAGPARLVVVNKGPDTHEILVARTSATLPLRGDGLTVDEDRLEPVTAGEAEGEAPGATEILQVKLRPGRYELFCNMAGHYLGGMSARLVAS
jgi:uncharacterized cupredoxin-like copper-binding protein